MSDLIAALEAATEGGRELDDAIWRACGLNKYKYRSGEVVERWPNECPHYTTRLGSTLLLVPEGWDWEVGSWNGKPNWAVLRERAAVATHTNNDVDGFAATPALALCIAALRARELG